MRAPGKIAGAIPELRRSPGSAAGRPAVANEGGHRGSASGNLAGDSPKDRIVPRRVRTRVLELGPALDRLDPGEPGTALHRDQEPRPSSGARRWPTSWINRREALNESLIAAHSSPSQQAVRREQAVLLADALQDLPEDYREVIILRQLEGLSFPDVARRMGRTEDSVKNVWLRALARLRRMLKDPQ